MQTKVIEIFKTLSKIPRCSFHADKMYEYLQSEAKSYGYTVEVDSAKNILCSKKGSKITLQAHYDMVCIGEAPILELYEEIENEKTWLKAKNSTLGADNGIAIAMMVLLMQEGEAVDVLFTSDEEVGLIGARELALELKKNLLLNLDSEEEAIVTLGCAGGVDVKVNFPITRTSKIGKSKTISYHDEKYLGGHSGVDIHLDIPNVLKDVAMKHQNSELVNISGGERRNSIAKRAEVEIYHDTNSNDNKEQIDVITQSKVIFEMINGYKHGVYSFNSELNIVQTSANLAMVKSYHDSVDIDITIRSMDNEELVHLLDETIHYFENFGAVVTSEGFYSPWTPKENILTKLVFDASEEVFGSKTALGAIHAGLECGILGEKMPNLLMASIGPDIVYPHSTREAVDINSVERVFEVVKKVLKKL